jgi:hypothetical protein
MHRVVWNLRAALPKELVARRSTEDDGLWMPPGRYAVRLSVDGRVRETRLEIRRDPRLVGVTDADLVRQHAFAKDVQAERIRVAAGLAEADALRRQIAERLEKTPTGTGAAASALAAVTKALDRVAGPALLASGETADEAADVEPANLRRVAASLARLQSVVESADAAPSPDAVTGLSKRKERAAAGLARWREWLSTDLPKLNGGLESAGVSGLRLP